MTSILGWTHDGECYCECTPKGTPFFTTDETPDGWSCGACGDVLVAGEWIDHETAVGGDWSRCVRCNGQQPTTDYHSIGDPCQSCGGDTIDARDNA